MAYDLLEEKWLFVRRRASGPGRIAPWQLVENHETDPVDALDFPRADLNGGVVQFLIGLLQTAFPPKDEKAWRGFWNSPPEPEVLRGALAREADAFLLDGDGPRFMQDKTLTAAEAGEPTGVASLFVETPGGKTEKDNADLFVKRGRIERLCPACVAAALFTLQTNAPSGGVGHRTGLRGGGPLTTLVLPARDVTLWKTVWGNVFPRTTIESWRDGGPAPREFGIYPWLAPTRTSEAGREIHPSEVDPLHAYWGMPRRIRLLVEQGEAQPCHLCGQESEAFVARFLAKNYGNNYSGTWRHPLTPYTPVKEGFLSMKGTPDGVGYKLWRGAVVSEPQKGGRLPAKNVQYAINNRLEELAPENWIEYRLWAFGPDMDNMKARSWAEGMMPVLTPPKQVGADSLGADPYYQEVLRLVYAAEAAVKALRQAVRYGLMPKMDAKIDASLFQGVALRFWSDTQQPFQDTAAGLRQAMAQSQDTASVRIAWLARMKKAAVAIYRRAGETKVDWRTAPEAAVRKEVWLAGKLSATDKEMANILNLPVPAGKPGKRGRKAG